MINKIISHIKRFLSNKWFRPQSKLTKETFNDKTCDGAITFKLNHDKTVDIACFIPEVTGMPTDKLTKLSEEYAELLVWINDGLLADKIIDFIKRNMKEADTEQEKLFLENILLFWGLLHIEYAKNKKVKSNQPLIKPSSVFNL
jgi:hypothetical protein